MLQLIRSCLASAISLALLALLIQSALSIVG